MTFAYHYNFLTHSFVKCISFIRCIFSSCQSYKCRRLTTDQYGISIRRTDTVQKIFSIQLTPVPLSQYYQDTYLVPLLLIHSSVTKKLSTVWCVIY